MLLRVLRDPFFRFLTLGALVFALHGGASEPETAVADSVIVVDAATQNWVYGNFSKQFGRKPTRAEMEVLIQSYVDNEVKYRQSLALGLDERDTIVHRRMAQKWDFLYGSDALRRSPAEAELQSWYEENRQLFQLPATVTFSHLYFNTDKRGASTIADARAAMEQLAAGEAPVSDVFPLENQYGAMASDRVRRIFGQDFAETLFRLNKGGWQGPITSGLGVHIVEVTDRQPERLLPLEEVRDSVLRGWRSDESKRLMALRLEQLKSRYVIRIDTQALGDFEYSLELAERVAAGSGERG